MFQHHNPFKSNLKATVFILVYINIVCLALSGNVFAQKDSTHLNKLSDQDKSIQNKINILVNQVAYDLKAPKMAIVKCDEPLSLSTSFEIVDAKTAEKVYSGSLEQGIAVKEWSPNAYYSRANFTLLQKLGIYKLVIKKDDITYSSYDFQIDNLAIEKIAIPAIVSFFHHQRANSPQELEADKSLLLYGSNKRVDLHGGWCDASGDVSK
jgi:hypothetical protein